MLYNSAGGVKFSTKGQRPGLARVWDDFTKVANLPNERFSPLAIVKLQ